MEVSLPLYVWFSADWDKATGRGNLYSGSIGTDPHTGSLATDIFEYTAIPVKDENKKVTLKVSCWVRPAWPNTMDENTILSNEFSGDQEGVDQATIWLNEEYEKSGVKIKV